MKFLCEQCKAKYQISDDKVAGKTVRMKCRKCGHMIEVRAEVTETSVSRGLPKEARLDGTAHSSGPFPATASGPHLSNATTAGSAATAAASPLLASSPSAAVPNPPASRPGPVNRPENNANARGLATSLSAKKPSAPRPLITPPPTPAEATVIGPPPTEARAPSKIPPASGALAGAFQKSISKDDPALRDITGLKEWYVAINGVPVGPVRIAELRRKASLGAVTEDSLVWQEGMEEWRPVKAYSELLALVREAAESGRPPLGATGDVRQSTPPPPKGGYAPRGAVAMNRPPPPQDAFRPGAARSNVLPFVPRNAAAEKLEDPEATEVAVSSLNSQQTVRTPVPVDAEGAFDPFAPGLPSVSETKAPAMGRATAPLSVQISPASGNVISPFAPSGEVAAATPSFTGAASDRSSVSLGPPMLASEPPPQKKSPPWIPIAMVVLAATFGLMAGWAVFFRQPVVVQAPPQPSAVASTPPPQPSAAPTADIELPDTPAASASAEKPSGSGKVAAAPKTNTAAPAASKGSAVDLSSLLNGTTGPSTGGGSTSGSSGGGSLTSDQVQSVVQQHQLGTRRKCWDASNSQQGSVNVTVTIQVSGSGSVSSASGEGNDPAITKCIETSVREWHFPATGGTSTVKIPFKFVRQ